jgi:ADP-heptose:LPS heptosyltransferase
MKKALIIRLSSAGDILLTAPVVSALNDSGYMVHILSKEKFNMAAAAVGADCVLNFSGIFTDAAKLNSEGYDVVIDLQQNLRSFILKLLVKSKVKRGYNKNSLRRRFMVLFKWFLNDDVSVSKKYLSAIKGLVRDELINLSKKPLLTTIKGNETVNFLIHAGAKWKNKRWPYFAELADELLKDNNCTVTITGVKDEIDNSGGLLYYKGDKVKNLIGKTDFNSLLECIKKCDIFIGNDTAAAHAAVLYKKPAFVFMGPTTGSFGFITDKDFHVLEKKGLMCRPCHLHGGDKCPINTFECMKDIPPQEAAEKIRQFISRGQDDTRV